MFAFLEAWFAIVPMVVYNRNCEVIGLDGFSEALTSYGWAASK